MRKVALITGISGQDGSFLAEILLRDGYEVHGLVRRSAIESSDQQLRNIRHLDGKVSLHTAPIDNHLSAYKVIAAVQPTELFHLAASSFVSYNFEDESSILSQNFNSTHYLLSSVKETCPSCRFLLAGSSEMFGDASASPQNEETPFNPRSVYGISKVASHYLIKNYRAQYGIFACTAFLYNHESPRRGMQFVTRKIAHAAARIKLGLQKSIILGDLSGSRDWGYAPDYAHAMSLMLRTGAPVDYVVSTGKLTPVRRFAELAFERVGLRLDDYLKVDPGLFRASEKVPLCGDSRRIQKELGWAHTKKFEEVVEEMVDAELAELKGRNS